MNKPVYFMKKSQILIADLWSFFNGRYWGEFDHIETLTMFPDYRVPQVLVGLGLIKYEGILMEMLKAGDEITESQEVEIRGNSIHCIEVI